MSINDDKKDFYSQELSKTGTSLVDLEYEWLKSKVSPFTGSVQDMWREYLRDNGYSTILSDGMASLPYPLGAGGGFISGSAVDLRFDIDRYRLNGQSVSLAAIDAYHSRASASWGQNAQGIWQEFPSGQMEVFPGLGYDGREGHTNLVPNPLGTGAVLGVIGSGGALPTGWFVNTGHNLTTEVVAAITLRGIPGYRIRISGTSNGIFYELSTSGNISISPSTAHNASCLLDVVAGAMPTNVVLETTLRDGVGAGIAGANMASSSVINAGLPEDRAVLTFTPNASASFGRIRVAGGPPNGTSVDVTFDIAAPQLVQRPYQVPFGVGTVAADTLVIPSADAGMAVNPSVTGVTMFWRGRDFESQALFPQLAEIRNNSDNRISLLRSKASGQLNIDFRSGGVGSSASASLASVPRNTEFTALGTWRSDGTFWAKLGSSTVVNGTRPPFNAGLSSIGVGNGTSGGDISNHITRRAGFLPYSLSDADALALFNAVNQGL